MLEELGHVSVDEAANGADALSVVARVRYALVISDWFVEPVSGMKLLLKLRRSVRGAQLPFVMMTSQNHRRFTEVARDAGATDFLAKPFTTSQLGEKIAALVDR